ncbi:hypothetical protein M8542_46075 [Amycolatopsis sp. OK19-0408]|uniref:Uncharacterized protein n=1 Tax=Amycolatopsis iheyensis TaxID=2945988 RepID=A0A9X2NP10_9PSEU|nr:hypothetical protein [Amycolatopsis iheyensis]MCR6490202.1 hypothetical protein [Amycolatopsis iheyensis]
MSTNTAADYLMGDLKDIAGHGMRASRCRPTWDISAIAAESPGAQSPPLLATKGCCGVSVSRKYPVFLLPGLVDLTVELLRLGLLDGARGTIAVNSNFWGADLSGLKDEDPEGAARVVGAYLNRQRSSAG